ncbi:Aste57867_22081 [Aphanomyces stellatus]|uniref:Aste57867_22081 protein n=1 Tax=Aphanomyces stellatus TaxID=120398 RepID=A0A485LP70_9STRA|nr:hypothetical protein As57867_022012 [Aphanomyces stellatus]VFT98749.1 Aste57867_22081 [Aphanomyces stellatus]
MMAPRPPLVLVCGWIGGSARAVTKYTPIFHRLGYETTVVPSTIKHFYLTPEATHPEVAARIRASTSPDEELVLIPHMLSNGGCISWYAIQRHLNQAGVRFHVPAMIFDSAPHSINGFHMYDASVGTSLDSILDSWKVESRVQRAVLGGALRLGWISVVARWAVAGELDPVKRNLAQLIERDAAVPKLFLYSDGDQLISSTEVEGAIAKATAFGTTVESVNFGSSPHVSHYVHAPEAYEAAVDAFLAKHVH